MPAFSYEALDNTGTKRSGTLQGDSAKAVRSNLRGQGLIPMQVTLIENQGQPTPDPLSHNNDFAHAPAASDAKSSSVLQLSFMNRRVFSNVDLVILTRQIASLLSAGLTLERTLATLAQEAQTQPQRHLLAHLRSQISAGFTLAQTLNLYPHVFSNVYVAVVAAGEQTGHLDTVMDKLANELEQQHELRAKIRAAALYPLIVLFFSFVIVILLMTYVVPQIATVFTNSKQALPLITQIILGFSKFITQYGVWLLVLVIVAWFVFHRAMRQKDFRLKVHTLNLKLPILGTLIQGYNTARFTTTLSLLATAGVPILKSLQAAAQTLNNVALKEDALEVLDMVREGAPLGMALTQKTRFPTLITMFAKLGEQTGELPQMLDRAAKQISASVQRKSLALATLLEPLFIIGMGVIVTFIVLAILMPIIQMNNLVK